LEQGLDPSIENMTSNHCITVFFLKKMVQEKYLNHYSQIKYIKKQISCELNLALNLTHYHLLVLATPHIERFDHESAFHNFEDSS
jgi:hypothetical protein